MRIDKNAETLRSDAFSLLIPSWRVQRFVIGKARRFEYDMMFEGSIELVFSSSKSRHQGYNWIVHILESMTGEWSWTIRERDQYGRTEAKEFSGDVLLNTAICTVIAREVEYFIELMTKEY